MAQQKPCSVILCSSAFSSWSSDAPKLSSSLLAEHNVVDHPPAGRPGPRSLRKRNKNAKNDVIRIGVSYMRGISEVTWAESRDRSCTVKQ